MANGSTPNNRVFVSSTCYDLIDLRAALKDTLEGAGLTPVLSDQSTSEFTNPGDANTIETCLGNLRSCDSVILVLSQRYGASLGAIGYGDVSATHLEYREAINRGARVLVYARDRLWGEYVLWLRNKKLMPTWAQKNDARKLFALLHEHAEPTDPTRPNWVWPFTTSSDLCGRVLTDLGATATAAFIRRLAEEERLPQFSITPAPHPNPMRDATFQNHGGATALRVQVRQPNGDIVLEPRDFSPGVTGHFKFLCGFDAFSWKAGHAPVLQVDYEIPTGHRLCDVFAILPGANGTVRTAPAGRQLVGQSLRMNVPAVVHERGLAMVELAPINRAYETNCL